MHTISYIYIYIYIYIYMRICIYMAYEDILFIINLLINFSKCACINMYTYEYNSTVK